MATRAAQNVIRTDSAIDELVKVVECIARSLVDEPEHVIVEADTKESQTTLFLYVGPKDIGKVIGRQGRTARALRVLLSASARKLNRSVSLSLEGSDEAS